MKIKLTGAAIVTIASLALVSMTAACGSKKPPKPMEPSTTDTMADGGADAAEDAAPPAPKTLFDRLGGKDAIAAVVDSFIKNASADPAIKKLFAKTTGPKLDHLKQVLIEQICEASGGPCKYSGKDMKAAHKGMGLTEAHWDAFVNDFTLALDENKVGEKEKSEVFAMIAPMHDDIVEKKAKK
jgi:hemoglobin